MAENQDKAAAFLKLWDQGQDIFEVFTSGSTGEPKAIHLHRRAMESSATITGKFLGITSEDSIHCCLPADKTGGFMQLVRSRVWNIPVKVTEAERNPLLNGVKGNIISLTPMQLHAVLENKVSANNLNLYRIVLIGGGDMNEETEKLLVDFQPVFYHTYGMTETCSHIAMRKCNSEKYFRALPGIETGLNESGCLTIRGSVTNGQWIETNDLAEIHDDGFLIMGRADQMINSGGIKIQPESVEKFLCDTLNLPENSIMLAGLPDKVYGQLPVLFVNKKMVSNPLDLDFDFPVKYSKPRAVYYLDELVYTSTGKLNRQASLEKFIHTESELP